ncbi:hypothetical protein [Leptospira santarosai]|uniref:hypothetical protein n=1 Tax=Leptospira santarosai TaxID=28183 RepID=UPI0003731658|nr:hypothetical protein [Leptospira santarosai]
MEINDFDEHTGYLKNPPPLIFPTFEDFKKCYNAMSNKNKTLEILKIYCKDLRSNGVIPKYIVLGGSYLRNHSSITGKLKILACFGTGVHIDHGAITNHLTINGDQAKKYKEWLEPIGRITLSDPSNKESLLNQPSVTDLRKDHSLTNRFEKVGLVCLSFNEVLQ